MKEAYHEGNKSFSAGEVEAVKPGRGKVCLGVAYCDIGVIFIRCLGPCGMWEYCFVLRFFRNQAT